MNKKKSSSYLAKVVTLGEDDDEITGSMHDPYGQRPFKVGEQVVRLVDNSGGEPRSETHRLSNFLLLNPDLNAESFTPIPEGEIIEE